MQDDAQDDFFSKVFNAKSNQAYDRRARQDKLVDYMASNFLTN